MSGIRELPKKVSAALQQSLVGHPYPRFAIDDVIDGSEYQTLYAEFPDSLLALSGEDFSASYQIRPTDELPEGLTDSWRNFMGMIRSDYMRDELVKACRAAVISRYPKLWRWLLLPRLHNCSNYEINVAFNVSFAGRYLPPHNDNSYKVLALVMYFAPADCIGSDEGTRFFVPSSPAALKAVIRRYNRLSDSRITRNVPLTLQPMVSVNIHNHVQIQDEKPERESWFYSNFRNDFNVAFKGNRIAGFIKTHNSFHEVDMRKSTFEGPRKSVLINLNLKHSWIARSWQAVQLRVSRLSS